MLYFFLFHKIFTASCSVVHHVMMLFYLLFRKPNIFDNIMIMMEKYTYNLEGLVQERTYQLDEEKKKTEALLHRVLPK